MGRNYFYPCFRDERAGAYGDQQPTQPKPMFLATLPSTFPLVSEMILPTLLPHQAIPKTKLDDGCENTFWKLNIRGTNIRKIRNLYFCRPYTITKPKLTSNNMT